MIIVQFNEAIKELLIKYSTKYDFKSIKKIILQSTNTFSEAKYENLEPWIQWVSFYSGKEFNHHKVSKLGEYKYDKDNFFVNLADQGKKIGIFCSMNQFNYNKFTRYVPDPWSKEKSDSSYLSVSLKKITSFLVNKNANLVVPFNLIFNFIFLILKLPIHKIYYLTKQGLIGIFTKNRSVLAGILDYFLFSLVLKYHQNLKLDISAVFLNGLAHVQHHYLFNSEFIKSKNPSWYISAQKDPIKEILPIYEKIFTELFESKKNFSVISGLSQIILDKPEFYWRFKNHEEIFKILLENIKHICIPKMSRDFFLEFNNKSDVKKAKNILNNTYYFIGKKKFNLFGCLEVFDKKLFGSLTYNHENDNSNVYYNTKKIELKNKIDFVAIKNSIHDEKGWFFMNTKKNKISNNLNIWDVSNFLV